MAEMRTEEEQIAAIRDWWRRNGTSLIMGIVLAVAIIFGWQAWQNHVEQKRTAAANQFSSLLNVLEQEDEEKRSESLGFMAKTLREEYPDTQFAVYGNLILARQQVMEQGAPEEAIETLAWAHDHTEQGQALELLVRSRLARAYYAAAQHDRALEIIRAARDPGAFAAVFAELEGDVLLAQGDTEEAGRAYREAREVLGENASGLLNLKLADLGIREDG